MPPFITYQGQTGYFQGGQFVPATQEQYNAQFSMYNQFGNNPFVQAQNAITSNVQSPQQIGTIKSPLSSGPLSNEQKVDATQGMVNISDNSRMQYGMYDQGLGFQSGKTFYPSVAMTASGHPLIGDPTKGIQANIFEFKDPNYNLAEGMNPYGPLSSLTQSMSSELLNAPSSPQTTTTTQDTNTQSNAGNDIGSLIGQESMNALNEGSNAFNNNSNTSGKTKMSPDEINQLVGTGIGVGSSLIRNAAQDKYDPRVGMSDPNALGTIAGDTTFTQLGFNPALMAATGGISAAVGGGIDLIKNIAKYRKQKEKYENKKLGVDTQDAMANQRMMMDSDFTGMARFGAEVKNPYLK